MPTKHPRNIVLSIRLSEIEHDQLVAAADADRRNISDYVRLAALDASAPAPA